jgi:hypothetical protein
MSTVDVPGALDFSDALERSCEERVGHGEDKGGDVEETHLTDEGHCRCWEKMFGEVDVDEEEF